MKPKVRDIVLEVLEGNSPMHPYGIYQLIGREYRRKVAYASVRWAITYLRNEGMIRRLSEREIRGEGLQIEPNRSGRSGWRPPINRSYYAVV